MRGYIYVHEIGWLVAWRIWTFNIRVAQGRHISNDENIVNVASG